MTTVSDAESPADPQTPEAHSTDALLYMLVHLADRRGFECGLTLNVGGVIVSGVLCGSSAYFEALSEELDVATGHEVFIKTFKKQFDAWAEEYKPLDPSEDDDDDDGTIGVVHLKDARYFSTGGASLPRNHGVCWRGRIDSVDGFSFGQMTEYQPGFG